ncbi:hypothetical protein [Tessaracoccus coleopterorum]|uniref:hypothetical protein n=1 Tax=Tessaracoccus coleopterorum TaxID=2714950 RepID=UPI001E381306|nr:hypothetical protein [Tessaracoccus coleopterorum]
MTATDIAVGAPHRRFEVALAELVQGNPARQRTLIALTDLLMVALVVSTSVVVAARSQSATLPGWVFATIPLAWLVFLALAGAYSLPHLQTGYDEYRRVASASLSLAGAVGIGCYLLDVPLSRAFFLVSFGLGIPMLLLLRFARRRTFSKLRELGVVSSQVIVAGHPGTSTRSPACCGARSGSATASSAR